MLKHVLPESEIRQERSDMTLELSRMEVLSILIGLGLDIVRER